MANIVEWTSHDDDRYQDTGEGGLFAYAFWDAPKAECFLESQGVIGIGDVMVDAIGPMGHEFHDQINRYYELTNSGTSYDDAVRETQIVFGGMLFLGSTRHSLFDDEAGKYFFVQERNLTDEGLALVRATSKLYGTEPTYVTFLDT